MYSDADFVVAGLSADGNGTVLYECDNSGSAIGWWQGYIAADDAGGWDAVVAYDTRFGEHWEVIKHWNREDA